MKKTEQQIKNLKDALVWWQTVPERNVDLATWRDESTPPYTCNTICCFGGWCAVQPLLVAQGVQVDDVDGSINIPSLSENGYSTVSNVALELFGDKQMFYVRGKHRHDKRKGSDHAAVTHRIKMALKERDQYTYSI